MPSLHRSELAHGWVEKEAIYVMKSQTQEGKFRIIDGCHRCEAAKSNGFDGKVPAIILKDTLTNVCVLNGHVLITLLQSNLGLQPMQRDLGFGLNSLHDHAVKPTYYDNLYYIHHSWLDLLNDKPNATGQDLFEKVKNFFPTTSLHTISHYKIVALFPEEV